MAQKKEDGGVQLSVRIGAERKRLVEMAAERERRSVSDWVKIVLDDALDQRPSEAARAGQRWEQLAHNESILLANLREVARAYEAARIAFEVIAGLAARHKEVADLVHAAGEALAPRYARSSGRGNG